MQDSLVVEEEMTIEEKPGKFKQLASKFKEVLSNPDTIAKLLKNLGSVPAAVTTVASALSGNIPVAVGALLVTLGTVLGQSMDKKYSLDRDLEMC